MYSQNDEEKFILEYLSSKSGRLLDIGAFDGKTFSNTLALLERGWDGVMIEPSPSVFIKLMENTKHVKVSLLNCAIALESKLLKFFDSNGDAISSFDPEHVKKWETGYNCKFTPYYIKPITMGEIFNNFGFDFTFINLDVESLNIELFKILLTYISAGALSNLKLLCIEHDGKHEYIENALNLYGFKKIALNGENIILVR